ncbi:MAG TPA: hypothetical protein VHU81_12545, partial [Thermoanaerobaculia bacterium]|nr:hypothetical protein [Thermoanaerobaculia bacterium]
QLSNLLSSSLGFDISGNTFLGHTSHAIFVTPGTTATNIAQLEGTISSNSIGNGTADSGSRDGYGIRLDIRGDVTATVAVTGNTIRNTDLEGIFVESRLDNDADAEVGHLDLTLRDNDAGQPDDNSAIPFGAIYGTRVEARNTTVLCLDIAANDAESVGIFEDIRLRQRDTSTFRLERFTGNGAVDTSVEGFVTGENPLIDNADATHSISFTGVANGFCGKP